MTGTILMLLNNGHVLVSREDYPALREFTWTIYRSRRCKYAMTRARDPKTGQYKRISMHRLITGAKPGEIPDHENNDGTDNRRENLRMATHAQNAATRRPKLGQRFRGVKRIGDQWTATVSRGGLKEYLGRFDAGMTGNCSTRPSYLRSSSR